MAKFFNTSGPCDPEKHYMIDVGHDLKNVRKLIDDERYFILHAPRQTGKTTYIINFARKLNEEGSYIAIYVNVEAGQACRDDVEAVNEIIIGEFENSAFTYLPEELRPSESCYQIRTANLGLNTFLTRWTAELPRPLVVFMDEADALIGDSLISVLRQLRSGYSRRPGAFPHALCLIGLRDIRDYRIYSQDAKRYIIGGSAFNIKEKSVRLENFTLEQVRDLYRQHTEATGQEFSKEAVQAVYEQTRGQPWLVNALGREICFEEPSVSQGKTVTPDHVETTRENLILRRDVHLDQLADKLTEPRVMRVIQPIIIGEHGGTDITAEDIQYLIDLGLIRKGNHGLEIANPIYREIIPRELTAVTQEMIAQDPAWYVTDQGKLDVEKLLDAYAEFYREHSEMITERRTYTEAAHHLFFMSWLQRIVNRGGTVTREYAAGLGRLDLCVSFKGERFAFELKLSGKKALEDGKSQLADYLDRMSLDSGYLLIFSRAKVTDWDKVGRREKYDVREKRVEVIYL
ncbi:MAG: ATP-binding protein [Desulfobacterales bacterium]|nr:ATP-binding protein [Desulfobacterales bacterium]